MLARRRVSFRFKSLPPRNPCSRSWSSATIGLDKHGPAEQVDVGGVLCR